MSWLLACCMHVVQVGRTGTSWSAMLATCGFELQHALYFATAKFAEMAAVDVMSQSVLRNSDLRHFSRRDLCCAHQGADISSDAAAWRKLMI